MADAGAGVAGSVSVEIGGNLTPFEAALAKAEAMAVAFDAKVSAILAGAGGSSSAFTATTQSATEASAAIAQITAPAAAASAAIDKIAATSSAAATGIDAAATSMDTGGINAKALAAALALTGNNLEKATALMLANADAAKAQAVATDTVTAATSALAKVQVESGVASSAGALVQTTSAAKALDAELGNTSKLGASASAEILRIGNDAARGNFGRLTSAAVVLSTRLGESGASALTFRNVLTTFGGLADVLFNPVLIALIGIPIALELAVKGFEALSGGGKSLNDVLKEQKTYLDGLAQSFPEAGKAAQDFLKIASSPTTAQESQQGFQSSFDLQNQQNAARSSIEAQLRSALNPAGNGPDLAAQYRDADVALGDLSGNFRKFLQDFVSGKTDAAGLATELANMYAAASPQERGIISQFETWLDTIQKTQAGLDANALAATRLTTAYQQLALAAADRKTELAATDNITKSLEFQIETMGQSNAAVSYANEYQEVWNKGIEAGATDLQGLSAQAASAAGQVAALTSTVIDAQAHSDLTFSISLLGLSNAQKQAATATRSVAGGDDASQILGTSDGKLKLLTAQINDFGTATDAIINRNISPKASIEAQLAAIVGNPDASAGAIAKAQAQAKAAEAILDQKSGIKAGGAAIKPYDQALQSAKSDTANLAAQQQALGLTAEQADKLTEQQKLLNEATKKGTDLSPGQLAAIDAAADAYAKQKAQLAALTDLYDTGKTDTEDFFSTLKTSLQNGESVWQSFGDAASKVLDDLANKALSFAADGIWNAIFSGIGGGSTGGGLLSGILGLLTPHAMGGVYSSPSLAAYSNSIVTSPTLFRYANGAGLMGEAGPEAIMPLTRMPSGQLGVRSANSNSPTAANANGNGGTSTILIQLDDGLRASIIQEAAGNSIQITKSAVTPVAKAVNQLSQTSRYGG